MCHILIFVQVEPLVTRYISNPVSTTESVVYEHAPKYPVLVVCNENIIKQNKVALLLQEINKMTDNNIQSLDYTLIAELEREIGRKIFKYGYNFEDMFVKCTLYQTKDCTSEKYWDSYCTLDMELVLLLMIIIFKTETPIILNGQRVLVVWNQ